MRKLNNTALLWNDGCLLSGFQAGIRESKKTALHLLPISCRCRVVYLQEDKCWIWQSDPRFKDHLLFKTSFCCTKGWSWIAVSTVQYCFTEKTGQLFFKLPDTRFFIHAQCFIWADVLFKEIRWQTIKICSDKMFTDARYTSHVCNGL